jgi:hypothetical protein
MQTTLRINDQLYREAKVEAARQGVTLTRFLEEGIRLRLHQSPLQTTNPNAPYPLPVHAATTPMGVRDEEIRQIAAEGEEEKDIQGLGISSPEI